MKSKSKITLLALALVAFVSTIVPASALGNRGVTPPPPPPPAPEPVTSHL